MKDMYLADGTAVTAETIRSAFAAGQAVLVHHYGDGCTRTSVMIDGHHFDTRNDTYCVWDAQWTTSPKTAGEVIRHASGLRYGSRTRIR